MKLQLIYIHLIVANAIAKLSAASRLKLFKRNVKQFFCIPIALICFTALDIQAEIMREFTLTSVEKQRNKIGNFLIFVNVNFFLFTQNRNENAICFAFITTS